MNTFSYFFELLATILLFSFGLHFEFASQKKRHIISSICIIFWGIYITIASIPFPNIFFIPFIILFIFKGNTYLKALYCLIYALFETIIANSIVFIIWYFFSYDTHTLYQGIDFAFYSISCILCIFFRFRNPQPNNFEYPLKKRDHLLLTVTIVIDFLLSIFASVFFFEPITIAAQRLVVFLILLMICMSMLILFLYFKLQHYHQTLQQTAEHMKKALKLEELHYLDMQQKNKDLRAFRHDYNHHILAMQELAKKKNYDNLTKYIENLSLIKEQTHYLSTNHTVADAIVNYFYEHLPEQTQFQLLGKFSKPFFVEESDLCIILSNLLKNAVEAIEKLPIKTANEEAMKRTIFLEISSDADCVQITLENSSLPYSSAELKHLNTSKTDTLNHGFGLQNVKQVVHKYHGTMDMQWDNGMFSTCVFLARE